MNCAKYVTDLIKNGIANGNVLSDVAWNAAVACVGWPYVYGARGQECTPAYRRQAYNSKGENHPTIKTACKNFDGSGSCSGCKWFPNGERVLCFDCRGLPYWILKQVYGFELQGGGCTSQWNTESNWKAKGDVSDGIPENTLCCLFYREKGNPGIMAHTGFYYNGETVECSAGVQHSKTLNKKWECWAVPACVDSNVQPGKPTLRKGDSGTYVTLLQTMLIQRGYGCGNSGADGKFGTYTQAAVRAFQADHDLKPDGVVGSATWAALEAQEPMKTYTVTIRDLTFKQAEALRAQYPDTTVTEERG